MNEFFEKVDKGIPINFDSYIKKFNKKNYDISKLFKAELKKKPYYILKPINNELYENLKLQFNIFVDKKTRSGSAYLGDSHVVKCSYSFLILKENINSNIKTLFFKNNEIVESEKLFLKNKIIIIENLENFGNLINNFKNISLNLEDYSFIYGAGKQINNSYFIDFFKNFDEVLCLFDIDYDGLDMYDNLNKNHHNCKFIYPENIDFYLQKSIKFINLEEIVQLGKKFAKNDNLHEILIKINEHKKYLEQELYLGETNDQ